MIEQFVEERFERDVKSFVKSETIYQMYLEYAEENGVEPLTQNKLTRALNNLKIGIADKKMINRELFSVRYGLKVK